MAVRTVSARLNIDLDALSRAIEQLADSFRKTGQHLRDFADPPSQQRRELRLIARAERAEAQLWWEQHKAAGRG